MTTPTDAADRVEIRDLLCRIAIATDQRDWSAFAGCFVAHAPADYGETSNGTIEEAVAVLAPMLGGYAHTMNFVGTHVATVDGDDASAETYVLSYHRQAGATATDDIAGTRYLDQLQRTEAGWRIARRVAELVWFRPADAVSSI
jgi:SnoaL-like protein